MLNYLTKKFQGFFKQEDLRPHFQHISGKRCSSFIGNVLGLRLPTHVITKPPKYKKGAHEHIVYVGCIHGGNDDILHRLKWLISHPPDYLIFTGDITGSNELGLMQKSFYDEKWKNPKGIYHQYEYFGQWLTTLSVLKRKHLLSTLQKSASVMLPVFQSIKKTGTKIIIIEGNWDHSQKGFSSCLTGPNNTEVFDTQSFFAKKGFPFVNKVDTLETYSSLHIFLPYYSLLNYSKITQKKLEDINAKIKAARSNGKHIVMIGHAEANWKVHHLFDSAGIPSQSREKIITNFGQAMVFFQPDEVIYPHQHERIRDESGHLVGLNTKYILQLHDKGIDLVESENEFREKDKKIIVTYIPFGLMALEES